MLYELVMSGSRSTKKKKKGKGRNSRKSNVCLYANKDNGEKYAYISRNNGNNFNVILLNKTPIVCSCKKSLTSFSLKNNDLVLIEPMTDKNNGRHLIIFKYSPSQISELKSRGELDIKEINFDNNKTDDDQFIFEGENNDNNIQINADENFIDNL